MGRGTFVDIRDTLPRTRHIHKFDDAVDKWWMEEGGWEQLSNFRKELGSWMDDYELFSYMMVGNQLISAMDEMRRSHRLYTSMDRRLRRRFRGRALPGTRLKSYAKFHPRAFVKMNQHLRSGYYKVDLVDDISEEDPNLLDKRPYYKVTIPWWRPPWRSEMLEDARTHSERCNELDKQEAGQRARELLFSHLTNQQREEYEKYGYFHVLKFGPMEGYDDLTLEKQMMFGRASTHILRYRRYRIRRGYPNGNVQIVTQKGIPIITFCLHPEEPYPNDDTLLAQKLLIESDEAKFITDANITPARGDVQFEPVDSFASWCRQREQRVGNRRGIRRL